MQDPTPILRQWVAGQMLRSQVLGELIHQGRSLSRAREAIDTFVSLRRQLGLSVPEE